MLLSCDPLCPYTFCPSVCLSYTSPAPACYGCLFPTTATGCRRIRRVASICWLDGALRRKYICKLLLLSNGRSRERLLLAAGAEEEDLMHKENVQRMDFCKNLFSISLSPVRILVNTSKPSFRHKMWRLYYAAQKWHLHCCCFQLYLHFYAKFEPWSRSWSILSVDLCYTRYRINILFGYLQIFDQSDRSKWAIVIFVLELGFGQHPCIDDRKMFFQWTTATFDLPPEDSA